MLSGDKLFKTMKKRYLIVFALGLALCGCAKKQDNKAGDDSRLLFATEVDEEDDDEISIVSSPDGSICLYSRNSTSKDATMGWSILYDVKDKDTVYTYEGLPDWQGEVSDIKKIFSLPHPKRNLYLFDAFCRISGAYGYQSFIAYERIGHQLKRVGLWSDEAGVLCNEIGFEYNIPDYYFRFARSLDYDYQYMWDEDEGIFYYPLLKHESYFLTDKFVKYIWNGKRLCPTTDTVANPHLYEPLRNYEMCYQHTDAGYIQARVDSLPDGRLRYAAWDKGVNVGTEPNIVLYGKRVGDEYHFYNPPTYTYVVTIEDVPEVRTYHSDIPGQLGELYDTYTDN